MYLRRQLLEATKSNSIFLFGARQTGKSTLLKSLFPDAISFDLLNSDVKNRFEQRPALLYEVLKHEPDNALVIIDEIQQVPELLNEVHRLIFDKQMRFVLCGSSARKLRRKGYNTLGGRAVPYYLYPLVSAEIPDFDLDCALNHGLLPAHYDASSPSMLMSAYLDVYLREEIKAEALVRNMKSFNQFLTIAAMTNGEMVNYNNIASDCGVSANTVKEYFSILEDTLLGYFVPAYTRTKKRRLVQAPRFYLFDVGLTNHMLKRKHIEEGTPEYGHAFEHFVIQELVAYISYTQNENQLSYWRTYTGVEVDAIIGDAKIAIEIKSAREIQNKHLKNLRSFANEYSPVRKLVVSLDIFTRRTDDDIELVYIHDFLKALWQGKYF
jgi:predicted AAA+ superfamily ATPase